jgi:ribonuclease HI
MQEIIIYCDGGCRGNQNQSNKGGWGAVLQYKEHVKELYGGEQNTTNNRMELTGAIRALQSIKTSHNPIKLHCDSAYVVNGINQWVAGWKKRGWRKSDGKKIENLELWKLLDELVLMQDNIEVIKVKGHAGVELNELADQLANKGMDEIND